MPFTQNLLYCLIGTHPRVRFLLPSGFALPSALTAFTAVLTASVAAAPLFLYKAYHAKDGPCGDQADYYPRNRIHKTASFLYITISESQPDTLSGRRGMLCRFDSQPLQRSIWLSQARFSWLLRLLCRECRAVRKPRS